MKNRRNLSLILSITVLILAPAAGLAAPKDLPKAPWSVGYSDGSGNGYRFWKDSEGGDTRFEYIPVQPKDSSTGMYCGGEPAIGVMKIKQNEELWERIHRLESDAKLRTEDRMKGTGSFHLKEISGERQFIILSGSSLDDFNQFLSAFRRGRQGLIAPPK